MEVNEDEETSTDHKPQGYYVYGSAEKLEMEVNSFRPVSGVVTFTEDGYEYYCCCKGGSKGKQAVELHLRGGVGNYKFGLVYNKVEIVEDEDRMDWDEIAINRYCIWLPQEGGYAMITSEWTTLDEEGKLGFPKRRILNEEFGNWRKT